MSELAFRRTSGEPTIVPICGNRFPSASQIGLETSLQLDGPVHEGLPTGRLTIRNASRTRYELTSISRQTVLAHALDRSGRILSTGGGTTELPPSLPLQPGATIDLESFGGTSDCRGRDARLTAGVYSFVALLHVSTPKEAVTVSTARAEARVGAG